jgi:hypothetical protein
MNREVKLGEVGLEHISTTSRLRDKTKVEMKRSVNRIERRFESTTQTTGKMGKEIPAVFPSLLAASKPFFEPAWTQNISAILGQPANLKCRVRLLADKMVCLSSSLA